MSGFLLDTSVVSELAPGRAPPSSRVSAWLDQHSDEFHLSVVTIAEIEQGIAKLRRTGHQARASRYSDWLERLLQGYRGRLIVVDERVASVCGGMSDAAQAIGRDPGLADILIAATARAHDLTLLTRNLRHFLPLGIGVVDPFATPPP